jgi:hypothetical protein
MGHLILLMTLPNIYSKVIVAINYAKSTDTYNNNGKLNSVNATESGEQNVKRTDLLIDALHAATPAIYDTIDDKRVLNKAETEKQFRNSKK